MFEKAALNLAGISASVAILSACGVFDTSAATAEAPADDSPDIIRLRSNDPEMGVAMQDARMALDAFLKLAANPPAHLSNLSLKVGLPLNDKDTEFVWVRPFRQERDGFVGRLVNTPRDFPGLSYGQQVSFDHPNVIDFAYRDGDVVRGHYTTCVLLKRMPDKQRADFLAQNPIACRR